MANFLGLRLWKAFGKSNIRNDTNLKWKKSDRQKFLTTNLMVQMVEFQYSAKKSIHINYEPKYWSHNLNHIRCSNFHAFHSSEAQKGGKLQSCW